MQIYLITHAHTRQQREVDAREWVLSRAGESQARALLDAPFWPRVAAIVTSSEAKTKLTAAPAAARFGLPIRCDARLDELRRSGWVEDYTGAVSRALTAPDEAFPGWESASSAQARALAALADLPRAFNHMPVAVVGHGISLSLVRASFLGQKGADLEAWQGLPFGAWAIIDLAHYALVEDFAFGPNSRGNGV